MTKDEFHHAILDGRQLMHKYVNSPEPVSVTHLEAMGLLSKHGTYRLFSFQPYMVNGVVVPQPLTVEPKIGEVVYTPDISSHNFFVSSTWVDSSPLLYNVFNRGLLYGSKEEAIARAKTMFNAPVKVEND